MSSSAARRALALGFLLSLAGCGACTEDPQLKPLCTKDTDCEDGMFCNLRTGICEEEAKLCERESQCCPGQICATTAGLCFDKFVQCTDATACTVKGQVCKPTGSTAQDNGCTFEQCGKDGECAAGTNCFNGWCVGEPPCNGGCAAGSVCTPVNNRCFTVSQEDGFPASCFASCAPGTILVFTDGANVYNRCDRKKKECACEALPPVKANDLARYTSAALAGSKVLVSAYDSDHGDLVLHTYDKAGFKLEKTEWIDGVPGSGVVVGDPAGPRGGRKTPGPDVGRYTALAHDAANSTTHIAYYAVKDGQTLLGDLRYAKRSGTGEWKTHTVDGKNEQGADTGDVGLYAAMTLAPDGAPVIAYFQKSGSGQDTFKTALKVARAKVREPEKASDWSIKTIVTGERTPPPCSNPACAEDEVCTASDANPNGLCRTKAPRATDCKNPSCGSDQACAFNAANQPACFDSLRASTLAGLPEGNGLMPAIAYLDDKPVVVWYNENLRTLMGLIGTDSASAGMQFSLQDVEVLDDGRSPGSDVVTDVGQFASLAIGPADAAKRIAVAYFDVTARQLRVLTAKADWADITPANQRVVDDGKGTPETDPVFFAGADTSIRFDSGKNVVVLYQDSTGGNLRLAQQQAGTSTFTLSTLKTEGAAGFYTNLLVDGADRIAAHTYIKANSASESGNRIEVFKAQ